MCNETGATGNTVSGTMIIKDTCAKIYNSSARSTKIKATKQAAETTGFAMKAKHATRSDHQVNRHISTRSARQRLRELADLVMRRRIFKHLPRRRLIEYRQARETQRAGRMRMSIF